MWLAFWIDYECGNDGSIAIDTTIPQDVANAVYEEIGYYPDYILLIVNGREEEAPDVLRRLTKEKDFEDWQKE